MAFAPKILHADIYLLTEDTRPQADKSEVTLTLPLHLSESDPTPESKLTPSIDIKFHKHNNYLSLIMHWIDIFEDMTQDKFL